LKILSVITKEVVENTADSSTAMNDETAKLIGAPPGYLDKVKTVPRLLGKV
jgi:hypothetical protein